LFLKVGKLTLPLAFIVNTSHMHIIKLNAIDSTNTYLRTMVSKKVVRDNTIVVTSDQTGGRGQMGTSWFSEPFKNLTVCQFINNFI
jgi:BirA family biotin operon repressor/biotin-[acetyl-CoA-carboxylase] ligase